MFVQRQSGGQVGGYGLVDEDGQCVAGLFAALHGGFVGGFGRFDESFLLAQVDGGDNAGFVADFAQAVGLFAAFEHFLRQRHVFFGDTFVEVGFGDGGDEGQVGGVAGGGAVEVAFEGGLFVAAGFAEEVEFIGGYAEADAVRFGDGGAAAAEVGGGALAGAAAAAGEGGEEGGAADAVLFAHGFGVEGSGAQVGVALQGDFDQAVQAGVGEVVLPAEGCGADGGGGVVVAEGFGHGDLRLLVFGNHGAGREEGCGGKSG